MLEKSSFLERGQGRPTKGSDSQAGEDERQGHPKSEVKRIPSRQNIMCKTLRWERIWHVEELESGRCETRS